MGARLWKPLGLPMSCTQDSKVSKNGSLQSLVNTTADT